MKRSQLLIVFLGTILLTILYFHPIQAFNQDLGRHILLGNIILSTHHIPDTNLLSYTHPGFPFINHHYLPEILYAILSNLGGYQLLFLSALIPILLSLILLTTSRKAHVLSLLSGLILFLGLMVERTDIRPEVFSYLFLSIFIVILFRNREKPTKLLFILPLIEVIWANTHIYFPLGLAVTGLFFLERIVMQRKNLRDPRLVTLTGITALCALAMIVNPQWIKGAFYPFTIMKNYGYTIEENQTPFFILSLGIQKVSFFYLFIFQLIVWIGVLAMQKRARIIDYFLAILFSYLSLTAVRNIPLFAIGLLPSTLFIFDKFFDRPVFTQKLTLILALCLSGCLLFQMTTFIRQNGFGITLQENSKQAVDFMQENKIKGPLFNNFDVGSYLAYRLYPKEKVFIDGRPEAYPTDFIQNTYIQMQQDPALFQKASSHYNFNSVFFTHTDQTPWGRAFVASIMQDKNFIPIYLDQDNLVLIKDVPSNKEIIKRYGLSQTATPLSYSRAPSEEDLKKAANFYGIVNQQAGLVDTLTTLVNRYPNNCEYLRYLLPVLAQNQSPTMALYQDRYQTQCQ